MPDPDQPPGPVTPAEPVTPAGPVNMPPAIGALNELACRAGAAWQATPTRDGRWVAVASWPHTEMVADGGDLPDGHRTIGAACNALAGMLMTGLHCPRCGRPVQAGTGGEDDTVCSWWLVGAHWTPSCSSVTDRADAVAVLMGPLRRALDDVK
jgi:hypothetical protein